jgi:hypothetical protein
MRTKTNPLAICVIAILFLASCTEAFKHKQEVANKYLDEMNAGSVTCGVLAETNNGESMSMTTYTFSDCNSHIEDIEREWAVNRVANEMLDELTEKDIEGETHMKIVAVTKNNERLEYLFLLDDLRRTEEFLKIADEVLAACIADDQEAIDKLKDDSYLPDDAMGEIYTVTHYNDSLYEGQKLNTGTLGYHFASGTEDDGLKLFSVDYDVTGESAHTSYTVNINRDTKKVAGIWLKTNPY